METRFEVKGLSQTLEVFENLRDQVGDAKKTSRILTKVAREAMKPVLAVAQMLTAQHSDTGMLNRSLTIWSGKPTAKDMRSNYVKPTDSAIAKVTTRPIPKHLKREVNAKFGHLWSKGDKKAFSRERKKFYASQDIFYDARAIATEFGTANRSANPFLRVSLESQQTQVTELAGMLLAQEIAKFKAKNLSTTK
ncbi:hypothetical protein EB001_13275 [bacterium]|jgi:hypothetical protein|nr:hypothetical protein [bacterium]